MDGDGGLVLIPILAIFFLSDATNLVRTVIQLVPAGRNRDAVKSLAEELNLMLQRYIRAKVILAALSLVYCSAAMFLLGFPHVIALGVLAGSWSLFR